MAIVGLWSSPLRRYQQYSWKCSCTSLYCASYTTTLWILLSCCPSSTPSPDISTFCFCHWLMVSFLTDHAIKSHDPYYLRCICSLCLRLLSRMWIHYFSVNIPYSTSPSWSVNSIMCVPGCGSFRSITIITLMFSTDGRSTCVGCIPMFALLTYLFGFYFLEHPIAPVFLYLLLVIDYSISSITLYLPIFLFTVIYFRAICAPKPWLFCYHTPELATLLI